MNHGPREQNTAPGPNRDNGLAGLLKDPAALKRVLLIDDEPGIRRMLALDLGAEGYEVTSAADGAEGLKLFAEMKPRLVITDIKMPGVDGMEVLKRIKQSGHEAEVVVITGHGDMDLAIQSLQQAAGDFVVKPIRGEALAVALSRARERLLLKARLAAYTDGLEEEVRIATEKALAAERMAAIGQTVASLGHTLKNLLVGLNAASYLLHKPGEERKDEGLEMLDRNLSRIKRLVKDLLHLASAHGPRMEPLDPAELAREALSHLAARAAETGVDLAAGQIAEGLAVHGEREALFDALLNLLSNALDAAAGSEGARVRLSLEKENGCVCFTVTDNGPGLSKEAAGKICQGFFTEKGSSGTGLGLMISNKTAKQHGGGIRFENLPAGGACFGLHLPLAAAGGLPLASGGREGAADD